MSNQTRLEALSTFLKSKRSGIQPQSVGLPAGTRRRTPGLRREEVAQLAGVSTTWYTWLEQGRDITVSPSVLDAVAAALQLNQDERKYVYDLALEKHISPPQQEMSIAKIPPSLGKILNELTHCPTIITDRHFHIVGWNAAAAYVFLDFDQVPLEQRNLIRLVFVRKELRSLAVNWEHFVRGFLAMFRAYYGQYVGDEWYTDFVVEMSELHPEFHALWEASQVSIAPDVTIEFRHAKAGKMLFNLTSLLLQGNMDLRCSVFTPIEHSSTEEKLVRFMRRDELLNETE